MAKTAKRGRYASARMRRAVPDRLQRMMKHVLESVLDRGVPYKVAVRIAAATVNKHRARTARGGRGPRLVGRGGSRRRWYPGKRVRRERLYCLKHEKKFKTKSALLSHYRSRSHACCGSCSHGGPCGGCGSKKRGRR